MNHNIDHKFKGAEVLHGDLLRVLPTFPDGLFGGIICDPPYASGAADQNAKQKTTAQKYSSAKTNNPLPNFEGDAKDQRSWTHWMAEWLSEARRCTKEGAPLSNLLLAGCIAYQLYSLPFLNGFGSNFRCMSD